MEYRVCPKCGCRQRWEGGPEDYCRQCHGPPKGMIGFHVNVLYTPDRVNWRVEILDPAGEVVFRKQCMNQEHARKLGDQLAQGLESFVRHINALRGNRKAGQA